VGLGALGPGELAAYRLGMPAVSGFLESLDAGRRARVWEEAARAAGAAQPYVARMLALTSYKRRPVDRPRGDGAANH
jgi:hypothetical protein